MAFGNKPELVSFIGRCGGQSFRDENCLAGFLIVDKRTASVLCSFTAGKFHMFRVGRVEQRESFALPREHIAIPNQFALLSIELMIKLRNLLLQLYLAAPKYN